MQRLAGATELLDGPLDGETLAGNLRDLARVNRWLGGSRLSWRAVLFVLRRHGPDDDLRILDIGTGAGDIPRYLRRGTADRYRNVRITATDVRPEIVTIAEGNARYSSFEVKLASPDRIEEPDGSVDIVHASMVLHHLEPPEAVKLLREMARVTRESVIVNDLDRARPWLLGAHILSRLATGNPYTRHDAPLSVRRAYRPDELAALAARAGLREVARMWARPRYRYALVFEPA